MDMSGLPYAPANLFPWTETPVSTEQEARWAHLPVWTFWTTESISLAPTGNITHIVQTAA